ncbi:protein DETOXIFICATION 24-like [Salvia hispanica]|uniref:protein DETOXIFICATION 24-like n=1 Tax=Salvia hispanica TaxID=49212 RepID=UPI0020096F0D|nr:protein DETOXIFICATION 24-like [Salvia hispanica]XP_047939001.1 protein DETOXIFICATION 24-like [Salvia hispanica]
MPCVGTITLKNHQDNNIQERLLSFKAEQEEEGGNLKGRICRESKKIWRIATPGVISRVSSFGTIVVTQSFVGHISAVDLAGYALVQTLSVRFVNGILIGMSSATETLCGQAYGAKQYHMMGIYLQRSWIIDLITLLILLPVFLFGTQIFNLLGQDEAIAKSAGYISLWFIPFVISLIFSLTVQMYLQAQQKNLIIAWLSALQFAIHLLCSWLFVFVLDLGLPGAMAALCISSWFLVVGEFVYIFGGWCPDTWKGFSIAAAKDLWPVVKLSVSSGAMICLELWYYAILVLLAGYTTDAQVSISAFSICLNINAWIVMIILGIMGAACVRVANELGSGNAEAVRFSIKVIMATSLTMGILFWILCLAFGKSIGYLFTSEAEVAETISGLSVLLAFTVLLGSIFPVLSGVAVGSGLQSKVAVINLICFYGIGLPVGIVLGYWFNLGVQGIWVGLTGGVLTQTCSLSTLIWRTNWDEEVSKTSARLKKWYLESTSDNDKHIAC